MRNGSGCSQKPKENNEDLTEQLDVFFFLLIYFTLTLTWCQLWTLFINWCICGFFFLLGLHCHLQVIYLIFFYSFFIYTVNSGATENISSLIKTNSLMLSELNVWLQEVALVLVCLKTPPQRFIHRKHNFPQAISNLWTQRQRGSKRWRSVLSAALHLHSCRFDMLNLIIKQPMFLWFSSTRWWGFTV